MIPDLPRLNSDVCRVLIIAINDSPGQEVCGFLVSHGGRISFRRLPNLGGAGEFWVDQECLDRVLRHISSTDGVIIGFIHSHMAGINLSFADESSIENSSWPWLVITLHEKTIVGNWYWKDSSGICSSPLQKLNV